MSRRSMLFGLSAVAGLGATGLPIPASHAATDRVVVFMSRLKGPMLQAARLASSKQFMGLILGHADVTNIALYSLGSYRQGLESANRGRYYQGVARYMSRYFALQAQEYRVTGADIISPSWQDSGSHYVDTKVHLEGGSTYTVRWELKARGGSFKITNVRVLGFWLAYFQRLQFEEFIRKRGGSVNALVAALSP